jgi:2',3'-cyclic-nucleotide 2'-phosphodiesterase (5'-nucleotidase family)
MVSIDVGERFPTSTMIHSTQNYSADTGDLSSFLTHLRVQAKIRGVDLLVIDSGDHHDGSGLVSSLVPQSTQTTGSKELDLTLGSGSRFADHILSLLSYDALAIGNHELYKLPDVLDVLSDVEAGMWDKGGKRRFLTSNVNVTMGEGGVGGEQRGRPVGERFVKFETEM